MHPPVSFYFGAPTVSAIYTDGELSVEEFKLKIASFQHVFSRVRGGGSKNTSSIAQLLFVLLHALL